MPKNDYITVQDVINEGEDITSQASAHNLWLKRLYVGPTGWPAYSFRGTKEDVQAFLLDVYMLETDDLHDQVDRYKDAPNEYVHTWAHTPLVRNDTGSQDTVTPTTDGGDG